MHGGGVYLYRERRADRGEVPLYDPPEPLAEVTGYHVLPLVTGAGQLHLLAFGNRTRGAHPGRRQVAGRRVRRGRPVESQPVP